MLVDRLDSPDSTAPEGREGPTEISSIVSKDFGNNRNHTSTRATRGVLSLRAIKDATISGICVLATS